MASDASFRGFRDPVFGRYLAMRFLVSIATGMQATAVGWQVYDLTGDPIALGFVGRWAQGWSEDIEREPLESIRLARAAIEADLDNTDVAYIAGFSLIFFATDQERALQLIDRSLAVNANCARA